MKKIYAILCLLLCTAFLFFGCGDKVETDVESGSDTSEIGNAPPETEEPAPEAKKYTIIRSEDASDKVKELATELQLTISKLTGERPELKTDRSDASENEIVIGNTTRGASKEGGALLKNKLDFAVGAFEENIVIMGYSDISITNGVYYFIENCLVDGKISAGEPYVSNYAEGISSFVPTVATPNRYTRYLNSERDPIYGAQHLQGMTMDDEGNVYFSFTGLIVKVNQEGEEMGVYKVSDELISLSCHLGNLYWHEGKIYIGLGISKTALSKYKRYIGVLDDSVFDDKGGYIQDNNKEPLLYGINIAELSTDRTFKNSEGNDVARFGGGGIDGITVGKLPGKGYILPKGYVLKEDITASDGSVYTAGTVLQADVEVDDDKDYLIAVRTQGSYDTYRYDDDNQQIMVFDFDDITEENLLPLTYERITNDDNTTINIKYNLYLYCGYHTYGTQVICYDKTTGDYLLWTYGRSEENNEFPEDSLTVVDGSRKIYLGEIEVGQSVPKNSENYRIALEYSEEYTDSKDLDNDGNTEERLIGWIATMQCVCEKGGIENHEAVVYGETGYAAKICGINTKLQGDNGCISLGNNFYYVAAQSNKDALREDGVTEQTAYGAEARIYYISRDHGAWTLSRVTSWN